MSQSRSTAGWRATEEPPRCVARRRRDRRGTRDAPEFFAKGPPGRLIVGFAGSATRRPADQERPAPARNRLPRVFLVDDHELFRAGVRNELGDAVEIVGEADDVAPAIELITERIPDVVLLDVHLPGGGGRRSCRRCKAEHPEVRFLALSVSDAPRT